MSRSRRPQLATVGFQGFGNLGDEALLAGIERLLDGTDAQVSTVFSGPCPETIDVFPEARRVVTLRHLPTLTALRRLRNIDLLILAGGGLFNDHWRTVVPRYAAWVLAARLTGARVAWVGVGVGPLQSAWSRWLTRLAAHASQVVLVRDRKSAALLGSETVAVVPDPSLFNDRPPARETGTELGLIVRPPTRRHASRSMALVRALAEVGVSARARGLDPVVLTMAGAADRPFATSVAREMARRGLPGVRCEALGPSVAGALERLTRLRAIVTVRLHGMLLGALAGVPSVPIAYDDKVRALASELELGDLTVDIGDVSGPALVRALDRLLDGDRRDALRERIETLRGRSAQIASRLLEAADRTR